MYVDSDVIEKIQSTGGRAGFREGRKKVGGKGEGSMTGAEEEVCRSVVDNLCLFIRYSNAALACSFKAGGLNATRKLR